MTPTNPTPAASDGELDSIIRQMLNAPALTPSVQEHARSVLRATFAAHASELAALRERRGITVRTSTDVTTLDTVESHTEAEQNEIYYGPLIALRAQLSAAQAEVERLKGELDSERESNAISYGSLCTEAEVLRQQLSEAKAEITRLTQKLADTQDILDTSNGCCNRLTRELAEAKADGEILDYMERQCLGCKWAEVMPWIWLRDGARIGTPETIREVIAAQIAAIAARTPKA